MACGNVEVDSHNQKSTFLQLLRLTVPQVFDVLSRLLVSKECFVCCFLFEKLVSLGLFLFCCLDTFCSCSCSLHIYLFNDELPEGIGHKSYLPKTKQFHLKSQFGLWWHDILTAIIAIAYVLTMHVR